MRRYEFQAIFSLQSRINLLHGDVAVVVVPTIGSRKMWNTVAQEIRYQTAKFKPKPMRIQRSCYWLEPTENVGHGCDVSNARFVGAVNQNHHIAMVLHYMLIRRIVHRAQLIMSVVKHGFCSIQFWLLCFSSCFPFLRSYKCTDKTKSKSTSWSDGPGIGP